MKKNYYFLATAVPPVQFGMQPEMDFEELQWLMQLNLSKEDAAKVEVVRRYYDIQNIRAFWKGDKLDPHGSLNEVDLEESLLEEENLPDYVFDFMRRYDSSENRLEHFPELIAAFFREESVHATGLLKEYLTFERDLRLVLTGYRAKQLGRDLAQELQYEDPDEDLVAQILAQKDAKGFVFPNGFQDLQQLLETHMNDPLGMHKALSEYRIKKLESFAGVELFSVDRILGYMLRLILAEKWIGLDKKVGLEVADRALSAYKNVE